MREVRLRVRGTAVEYTLDRLLLIVPGGVRELPAGDDVDLVMRGADLPPLREIARAAGRRRLELEEREVPDDWRERRLLDYRPDPIDGRLIVRAPWAPSPPAGLIDIVLHESPAFGGGTHPTTRTCLELLLEIDPAGAFADLGCGTGVLAILAARLGWAPVLAIDVHPLCVDSASENAVRNGVEVDVRALDLSAQPPPPADGFAANVPAALHSALATGWGVSRPRVGVLSGFGTAEADDVSGAYAACGLVERRRVDRQGWSVVLVAVD
jgi:ribosomal protein L11 methyltransferase